ncbi:MAG TPA: hypothetical protein VF789_25695 [Thermoanaerobaculia bacterium]
MKIEEIIWLEDVIEKLLRKHEVRIDEVMEVFENRPQFRFVEEGNREGEHVYLAQGRTEAGGICQCSSSIRGIDRRW